MGLNRVVTGRSALDAGGTSDFAIAVAPNIGGRWYAVHCQPHRERTAALHLRRQSYNVFLPLERKTRRHARRFDTVLRPFFPGYLFLSLDSECDPWRPINGTFGVLRIVTSGDRPTPAPVGVVEALKNLCNADGMLARQANLELRQTVRVTEGPFADLVGKLHRLDTGARVCVLLDMMDGAVTAWLPRSNVTTAENSI